MARRVHQLAKDLGVKSAAIVSKCQAEGLDIKNHMATLSAGLEATIQEWFSEGTHNLTVETTARVDLKKVRTRKKTSKQKTQSSAQQEDSGVAVAVAPAIEQAEAPPAEADSAEIAVAEAKPSTSPPKKPSKPRRKSPKELQQEVESQPDETEAVAEATGPTEAVAEVAQPQTGPRVIGKIAIEPAKTKKVVEAVPHVPQPAKLQGPKVVRVERADVVPERPRRSARRSEPAASKPTKPLTEQAVDPATDRRGRRRAVTVEETDKEGRDKAKRSKTQGRHRGRRGYDYGLTVGGPHKWGDLDLQERQQRLAQASGGKLMAQARRLARDDSSNATKTIEPRKIEAVVVKEPIMVKDLCSAIGVRANEIIGKLMEMGVMAGINQVIDAEAAMSIAMEFGVELTVEEQQLLLDKLQAKFDEELSEDQLKARPPVVAFLGHVDHGKTSLLDHIRKSSVVNSEAGGITQHIGSYLYDDGQRRVAFLDTPGHKAFTAMRARGANMTDIVVLVVAADDGVMPQTEEAISHAKASGVPIVVALNKIDLPNADVNRVLGQLAERELVPTEWGGSVDVVQTSALTGEGIEDLVEHLDYIAELNHLRSRADGPATGWVVEAQRTANRGVLAQLLIKSGEIKIGDTIVSGGACGRVRSMIDATGRSLQNAGPATPVEITGLDEVPTSGDRFYVADNISLAKEIAAEQKTRQRDKALAQRRQVTLDNLFTEIAAGEIKEFNVIIKADVQGSVDVLHNTVMEMNTSEVAVCILHSAVGGISESDVLLAEASNAIIIGFQVTAEDQAKSLADEKGVEIRLYRVIYQISDDIKKALEGMLSPRTEEKPLGKAQVRQVFRISRVGIVAGCLVTEGVIKRGAKSRLVRDNIVIRDDTAIESLRRVKDDLSEVRNGLECGIKLVGFDDIKVDDVIDVYELVKVTRTLEPV